MIDIGGEHLTCAQIGAVASGSETVALADEAMRRVARSHGLAESIARERPVYGRSTGVGANRTVAVNASLEQAHALLRSHATSAGPLRSAERVRAMLVVRLNQLAAGGSGISPAVVTALAAMLQADALPQVREHVGIGTGDLAAMATTALALTGEGRTTNPLPSYVELGAPDALPFMSSNAAAIADAALAHNDFAKLARAGAVIAALTLCAVDGNPEAFAEAVELVTPFEGSGQVCRWMRALVDPPGPAARIQDSFGLRTFPQVHGAALDALAHLDDVVCRLANAPSENPVILAAEGGRGLFAHHGGFHAAYLAGALDATLIAVTQSAQLSRARLAYLCDPAVTGLTPFLSDGRPGSSGVMVLEYVGASALGNLRSAAIPSRLQTVVLSNGVEDDASFASQAARQAIWATGSLRTVLACELVAAVRAVRARGRYVPAPLARALAVCAVLPDLLEDRDLTPDISAAEDLLPGLARLLPS